MGLYFDYSKNRITSETTRLLLELAEQSGLRQHIDAMFAGNKINVTEQRAVGFGLPWALRAQRLYTGHDLADRFIRSVGRRARRGPGRAHYPRAWTNALILTAVSSEAQHK